MAYTKQTWQCGDEITADKLNHIEDGIAQGGGESLTEITHAELLSARNNGTLTPGTQYRITDYVCTTIQEGSRAVSNQFDIIVVADDENTLNENARACLHDGDTYYSASTHSAVLESWELKYCIDNDPDRFGWADTTNGKGVVYWLKDERGNECPYDFKQIQFSRDDDGTTNWYYTFSVRDGEAETVTSEDASVSLQDGDGCVNYGNIIRPYIDGDDSSGALYLNGIVFNNTFGNYCNSNTFGDNCFSNTFGDNCFSNTFGDLCNSNTFGNYCRSNTFGGSCFSNTFGDLCNNNTFGGNCNSNTIGDNCNNNTFGDYCSTNTFGNNCSNNTFGNNCSTNTFGNGCNNNTFGGNCGYINFFLNASTNNNRYYKILSGTSGTYNSRLAITGTDNNNYVTYVGKNSSGTLKTWVPADMAQ